MLCRWRAISEQGSSVRVDAFDLPREKEVAEEVVRLLFDENIIVLRDEH